jgi:hypothetical protein
MSLSELAMWETWQTRVRDGLPFFARSPLYVDQTSVDQAELEQIAATLRPDPIGQVRDAAHGATVFQTAALGPVTRMWVDSCVEIRFLQRILLNRLPQCDVLEIGAGYGRLAVMLAPLVRSYTCVDPVAVSTDVCRTYTALYQPSVQVLTLDEFQQADLTPTLAINIHSWNECTLQQIARWLAVLDVLSVPLLFTVSHSSLPEDTYRTREDGRPSFRPLLEARYDLLAEESIGLGKHPHALWVRR